MITTLNYNAFLEYAKDYFLRYNIKVAFSYIDIVHNILLEHPEKCLEDMQECFNSFINKEKRDTKRAKMHEQDIDRERISSRDAQIANNDDPVKQDRNKKNKNKWHCDKRKKDKPWAQDRDIHNNEYQKEKYKNDEEYRLKKNRKDHDYYLSKHPKKVAVNDEIQHSAPSVKATLEGDKVINIMNQITKNNPVLVPLKTALLMKPRCLVLFISIKTGLKPQKLNSNSAVNQLLATPDRQNRLFLNFLQKVNRILLTIPILWNVANRILLTNPLLPNAANRILLTNPLLPNAANRILLTNPLLPNVANRILLTNPLLPNVANRILLTNSLLPNAAKRILLTNSLLMNAAKHLK